MDGMLTVVGIVIGSKLSLGSGSTWILDTLCISCCIDVEFLDFDGAFLLTVLSEVIVFCC